MKVVVSGLMKGLRGKDRWQEEGTSEAVLSGSLRARPGGRGEERSECGEEVCV